MPIVVGLLILTCAGLMVGHGYHMFRHKETPKSEHHMTMSPEHEHGPAAEATPGIQKEDEEQKKQE